MTPINDEQKELIIQKYMAQKEKQNSAMRKVMRNYYSRHYKILDTDSDEEKERKRAKIEERRRKGKEKYTGDKAEKQRIRMREYRKRKKEQAQQKAEKKIVIKK